MDEEKNNSEGPTEPTSEIPVATSLSNIVSLSQFKADKKKPQPEHWPAAIPQSSESTVLTVTKKDPLERRILISSTYGDIVVDGYLGLSQTFLAVGDAKGQIKFALAPGVWLAASDVTDNPEYQDGELEFELVPDDDPEAA